MTISAIGSLESAASLKNPMRSTLAAHYPFLHPHPPVSSSLRRRQNNETGRHLQGPSYPYRSPGPPQRHCICMLGGLQESLCVSVG